MNSVTFADLADELRVSPEELVPLVTAGYLVVVENADKLKDTVVGKPTQNMIDWFRAMLGPVNMRPVMPIKEVARMFKLKPHLLIDLCDRFQTPIYEDLIFGGLLSARSVLTFYKLYQDVEKSVRVDRQTMVDVFSRMKGKPVKRKPGLVRGFESVFEAEIQRIVALPEPQRTMAATAFWKAFNDADQFTDLPYSEQVKNEKRVYFTVYKRLKEKAMGIEKVISGKSTWEKRPFDLKRPHLRVSRAMTAYWKKKKAAEAALRSTQQ